MPSPFASSLDAPLLHHRAAVIDRVRAFARRGGPNLLHIAPLPEAGELAERLCSLAGPDFRVALLATGEGDAFDNALKLARAATGRRPLLAWPGPRTARSFGARSLDRRSPRGSLLGECEPLDASLDALASALRRSPAALLIEPLDEQLRPYPAATLQRASAMARDAGSLLLVDETLTGLGRSGSAFAFQRLALAPDAVVIGQALGAGALAIAATVATASAHQRAFGHQHTFDLHTATMAGNAAACEAALGLLDALRRHDLVARSASLAERLRASLARLPAVEVRGLGLLVALALPGRAAQVARALGAQALGPDLLLLAPPLDATDGEIDALAEAVARQASVF